MRLNFIILVMAFTLLGCGHMPKTDVNSVDPDTYEDQETDK